MCCYIYKKKKKNDFNVLKLYVCGMAWHGMAACDLKRENSTGNWGKWVTVRISTQIEFEAHER